MIAVGYSLLVLLTIIQTLSYFLYNDKFQLILLKWLSENKRIKNVKGQLEFTSTKTLKKYMNSGENINARILATRDTNT